MPVKIYFIQEHLERTTFHGGIGNIDAEKIFLQLGFKAIWFPYHYNFSLKAKAGRLLCLIRIFFSLSAGAVVIFQFPLYARMDRALLRLLAFRRSIRVFCFITDINGLKSGDKLLLAKEIVELQRYHSFIVHNQSMEQWLHANQISGPVAKIGFFDFLTPPVSRTREKSFEIVFAGNLEKSGFLTKLGSLQEGTPELVFNIYGRNPPDSLLTQSNLRYKGFSEPHSLPQIIEGSFGLVWDGESVGGAEGSLGSYMSYISHHKLSLYILCGLPIITASWAASASLVSRYGIGIAINSLYELRDAISKITSGEFRQMRENMQELARQISGGKMLSGAIDHLLSDTAPGMGGENANPTG